MPQGKTAPRALTEWDGGVLDRNLASLVPLQREMG